MEGRFEYLSAQPLLLARGAQGDSMGKRGAFERRHHVLSALVALKEVRGVSWSPFVHCWSARERRKSRKHFSLRVLEPSLSLSRRKREFHRGECASTLTSLCLRVSHYPFPGHGTAQLARLCPSMERRLVFLICREVCVSQRANIVAILSALARDLGYKYVGVSCARVFGVFNACNIVLGPLYSTEGRFCCIGSTFSRPSSRTRLIRLI